MKTELIYELTSTFEAHAQLTENGIEFWLARDLQHLLGYTEWRNFATVISKAKTACEVSGHPITDHFVDVTKMVELGSGSKRDVDDLMLIHDEASRTSCKNPKNEGMPLSSPRQNGFALVGKIENLSPHKPKQS